MTTYSLGRHLQPNHDPRSLQYPAETGTLASVRHAHHGPVLDQGNLGSCTGNACAQALNTEPLYAPGRPLLDEKAAVAIYSWATHHDPVAGAYPPQDTGSDGLSVAKAAKTMKLISSYAHAFGLDHVLGALVLRPVIIGIPWLDDMFNPGPDGRLSCTGAVAGGHEVCLDQIDVEQKRVWLLNSWSGSWGIQGRAWMAWDDLGKLLAQQGDATVLIP